MDHFLILLINSDIVDLETFFNDYKYDEVSFKNINKPKIVLFVTNMYKISFELLEIIRNWDIVVIRSFSDSPVANNQQIVSYIMNMQYEMSLTEDVRVVVFDSMQIHHTLKNSHTFWMECELKLASLGENSSYVHIKEKKLVYKYKLDVIFQVVTQPHKLCNNENSYYTYNAEGNCCARSSITLHSLLHTCSAYCVRRCLHCGNKYDKCNMVSAMQHEFAMLKLGICLNAQELSNRPSPETAGNSCNCPSFTFCDIYGNASMLEQSNINALSTAYYHAKTAHNGRSFSSSESTSFSHCSMPTLDTMSRAPSLDRLKISSLASRDDGGDGDEMQANTGTGKCTQRETGFPIYTNFMLSTCSRTIPHEAIANSKANGNLIASSLRVSSEANTGKSSSYYRTSCDNLDGMRSHDQGNHSNTVLHDKNLAISSCIYPQCNNISDGIIKHLYTHVSCSYCCAPMSECVQLCKSCGKMHCPKTILDIECPVRNDRIRRKFCPLCCVKCYTRDELVFHYQICRNYRFLKRSRNTEDPCRVQCSVIRSSMHAATYNSNWSTSNTISIDDSGFDMTEPSKNADHITRKYKCNVYILDMDHLQTHKCLDRKHENSHQSSNNAFNNISMPLIGSDSNAIESRYEDMQLYNMFGISPF